MNNLTDTDVVILTTTFIIFIVLGLTVSVATIFYKKRSKLLLERERRENEYQKELAIATIEMKETTLTYIGQELHDDLGQKMSVAKLLINQCMMTAEGDQANTLHDIAEVIGESIKDIRALSKSFISEQVMHMGLLESIKKEIVRIDKLNLMRIYFEIDNSDMQINSNDALFLFRIFQECLNNALKHSKARNMNIIIQNNNNDIMLKIEDDGIGFDLYKTKTGSGLLNIQKRAKLIDSTVSIASELGKGSSIKIIYKKQQNGYN